VEGGRQLTEEEITGLLIAVLFAGQHTSSITSSWTGIFMIDSKVGGRGGWGAGWGLGRGVGVGGAWGLPLLALCARHTLQPKLRHA